MNAVDRENPRHATELLRNAEQSPEFNVLLQDRNNIAGNTISVEDVSCETNNPEHKLRHYVAFTHTFETGGIAAVQLHAGVRRALLSPVIQLFKMTPTLDFCFEHRNQPIECFSEYAEHIPNRANIRTYLKTWMPIIEMTSAFNAVEENETAVVQGVKIEWQYYPGVSLPTGSFTLKKSFCGDRLIKFGESKDNKEKTAFLCIRYSTRDHTDNVENSKTSKTTKCLDIEANRNPNPHAVKNLNTNKTKTDEADPHSTVFVAHATTLDVKDHYNKRNPANSTLTVFFEVNQMSGKFPAVLRKSGKQPNECTVEVIPVLYPDSRLKLALLGLPGSSSLVKSICLLAPFDQQYDDDSDRREMQILAREGRQRTVFNFSIGDLHPLNRPQGEAIRKALTRPFTVIQGPPGTGKTMTGAYLAFFFTEQNKHLPNRGTGRPQILYCGPSNKSVDVITEYLKNFNKMAIIRVYSNEIESREFPIPGIPRMAGKIGAKETAMDPRHKFISLHHLIRMRNRSDGLPVNSQCDKIRAYDRKFQRPNYEPARKEIKEYHKLISKAEIEELAKYQVILATCNAAGSDRIMKGTNIKQCIVDEAGMCNEPETLIPLVATKPLQVVLIGDHKQLRPIIKEHTAQLLGMEISLLQRYTSQMNMLTIQYRMHEEICRFPSTAFYDGRLVTPPTVQRRPPILPRHIWPSGGSHPMAFCHCMGTEETLSVHTAEGNEMSKANMQEVEQAVRMARVLIDVHKMNAKDIVVLSQYRLQCDKISTALAACGKGDVDVRTVVQSQGSEWNIVILSTVRSLPRVEIEENPGIGWMKKFLGFIADPNQMNVALTRAKHGLIIVGNKYLLRTHKRWRKLLEHYEEHNCMANAVSFLR